MTISRTAETLVLLSGGIDSTACVGYYLARSHAVRALIVNYGQPAAERESRAADAVCRALGIPLAVASVLGLRPIGVGEIPGRNALLAMVALMDCPFESGIISMGIHAGTGYPDCSVTFCTQVQEIYDLYTGGRIRLDVPFVSWTKRDIYRFALAEDLPLALTYSCLRGCEEPCGVCAACQDLRRLRAS